MNFQKAMLLVITMLLLTQCKRMVSGKGNVITDERSADAFHSVKLEGAANVNINNGSTESISVKGYENLVPMIKTSVKDGQLIISMDHEMALSGNDIEVNVTTPSLNEVIMTGAGNIQVNSFNTPRMKLTLSGAGNIRFSNSQCDSVDATLSGAGNMYVNARMHLEANIHGVGNIEYVGNPTVNSKVSGVGKVVKR